VVALAMHTGIAPAAWQAEDPRVLETALHLLAEQNRRDRRHHDDGPQMSG
jgi:hypothetical protein